MLLMCTNFRIRGRVGFVTGPDDLNSTATVSAPRVFVGTNNQQFHLIAYEVLQCLPIPY